MAAVDCLQRSAVPAEPTAEVHYSVAAAKVFPAAVEQLLSGAVVVHHFEPEPADPGSTEQYRPH